MDNDRFERLKSLKASWGAVALSLDDLNWLFAQLELAEARAAALQSHLDQSEQFWQGKMREAGAREEELRHLAEMVLKYQHNHSWELKQIIYAKAEELVKSRPEKET